MMSELIYIRREKPEFGNKHHIRAVRNHEQIMTGQINFAEIEWEYARDLNSISFRTGAPRHEWILNLRNADCVVCYIPCPGCGRYHKLMVDYDPLEQLQCEEWIRIDDYAKEFSCWNCGLEFEVDDDRSVYVKQEN